MPAGFKAGGRQKGTKNKATAAKAAAIAESGITPLDFMLNVMREPQPVMSDGEDAALFVAKWTGWRDRAFEAAKAAAPYVHPKLATTVVTGKDGEPVQFGKIVVEIVRAP